jgi:hypothetical protein
VQICSDSLPLPPVSDLFSGADELVDPRDFSLDDPQDDPLEKLPLSFSLFSSIFCVGMYFTSKTCVLSLRMWLGRFIIRKKSAGIANFFAGYRPDRQLDGA